MNHNFLQETFIVMLGFLWSLSACHFHLYCINIFFQITVKYGSNYWSRIMNSEVQKSACKAILNNRNPNTCIKSLTKDDQFKSALLDCLCKEIRKQVCNLCSKDETLLKYDDNIKWKQILDELILKATSIVRIFKALSVKTLSPLVVHSTPTTCALHFLYCYIVETTNFRRFNMSSALLLISVEPPKRYKTNLHFTL